MKKSRMVLAASAALVIGLTAWAGVETLSGTEEGFWNNRAAIVARIASVSADPAKPQVQIDVLGVMATDILVLNKIEATYASGRNSALIGFQPQVGDTMVMIVERHGDGWALPSDYLTMLEGDTAVVKIDNLQDPKLETLAAKIRQTRMSYFAKNAAALAKP